MQDIQLFVEIMDKLYDYSSSTSGGCIASFKKLLPDITKALDLSKDKDWYRFCVRVDNRNNPTKYFDLSKMDLLDGDGNLLADLFKPEEITLKIVDRALHAKIPISISRLKANKEAVACITNKYIANQVKEKDKTISDLRLLSLWKNTSKTKYKNELTFKKAFNVYTLSEQLNLLQPDKWCVRYKFNLKAIRKILTDFDLGDPFNKIVTQLIEFVRNFNANNGMRVGPWQTKVEVRLISEEPNDDMFKAYVRLQGKQLPSAEAGKLTDTEYLFQYAALISDYCAAKYTEPMKGKTE